MQIDGNLPIDWIEWLDIGAPCGSGSYCNLRSAADPITGERFAIKLILRKYDGDNGAQQRFRKEIEIHCRLRHSRIPWAYGYAEQNGRLCLVLAFISGKTLEDVLDTAGALPIPMALALAADLAGTIGFIHRSGVIHRDIKPGNILLPTDGEGMLCSLQGDPTAYLFDFGLAFLHAEGDQITQMGMTVGSANFMSPEQARGMELDERSDLYSFGATLYGMFTGRPVFEGRGCASIMLKHIEDRPDDPRQYNSAIPEGVAALILKSLEKEPGGRFQTAEEMGAAIQTELDNLQAEPAVRA